MEQEPCKKSTIRSTSRLRRRGFCEKPGARRICETANPLNGTEAGNARCGRAPDVMITTSQSRFKSDSSRRAPRSCILAKQTRCFRLAPTACSCLLATYEWTSWVHLHPHACNHAWDKRVRVAVADERRRRSGVRTKTRRHIRGRESERAGGTENSARWIAYETTAAKARPMPSWRMLSLMRGSQWMRTALFHLGHCDMRSAANEDSCIIERESDPLVLSPRSFGLGFDWSAD